MSGFLRGCLLTTAVGALLIAAVLGGTYYLLNHPSPLGKELGISTGTGGTAPTPRPEAAKGLEIRLEALSQGQGAVLSMQVSQEELNALIAQNLPRIQQELESQGAPFQVEGLKVVLEADRVLVAAQVEALGFQPTVTVAARLSVYDGWPRVGIEEAYLGRLPLPRPLIEQLDLLVKRGLEQLPLPGLPLELRRLHVEPGSLLLEGVSR